MQPVQKSSERSTSPHFEPLLDLREAAAVLGMHWKRLEGMAHNRKVPALKVGKRWRFRLSSLNTWLENELTRPQPAMLR